MKAEGFKIYTGEFSEQAVTKTRLKGDLAFVVQALKTEECTTIKYMCTLFSIH